MLRRLYSALPASVRRPLRAMIGNQSFSAHGEDLLMTAWLSAADIDPSSVTYLDIGASHPSHLSNTVLAYKRGASGVLVEPDPDVCRLLRRWRPRDFVIESGVAFDDQRSATMIRFQQSVFNTFSEEQAQSVVDWFASRDPAQSRVRDRIECPLIPIMEIAERHFTNRPCHILDVDAEGVDDAIMASIDFDRFSPWLICIERPSGATRAKLAGAGYEILARTPHNTVFASQQINGR